MSADLAMALTYVFETSVLLGAVAWVLVVVARRRLRVAVGAYLLLPPALALVHLIQSSTRDQAVSAVSAASEALHVLVAIGITIATVLTGRALVMTRQRRTLAEVGQRLISGVVLTDARGRITWINDGFTRLTGYTPDEAIGRSPGSLLQGPGTDAETVRCMRKGVATGHGFNVTITNYHKDGTELHLQITCEPVLGHDGRLEGFFAIETDRTQEHICSHERDEIFAQSPAPMFTTDAGGRFQRANPATSSVLGYTSEELRSHTLASLAHPDDAEAIGSAADDRRAGRAASNPATYRLRSKDGSYRTLQSTEWALHRSGVFAHAASDVTDRGSARREREAAQRQRALLAENSRDGLWIWNLDTMSPEYYSPGMERIWGVAVEELMSSPGRWSERVVDAALREDPLRHMREALSTGAFDDTYQIRRPDGSARWVRCRGQRFRDPADGALKVAGSSEDITEHREMVEALRSSERRFREITETVDEVFWIISADGNTIEYASPAAMAVWGVEAEALQGDARKWLRLVHADDAARVRDAVAHFIGGGDYDISFRIVKPSGVQGWVRVRGYPVHNDDGVVERFIGCTQDVTPQMEAESALRDSEARFREIVETAQEGILLVAADGTIAYANTQLCNLLRCGPACTPGAPVEDLLGSADGPSLTRALGETRVPAFDCAFTSADGRVINTLVSSSPLRDHMGRHRGSVLMISDITERRRAERELLQAQKMEAVGQLASGIAHDFNNLLTAIFGHLRLAQFTLEPNHPARHSLATVEESARQASGVTKSLLAFSRRTEPKLEPVPIIEPIEQTERLLARALPGRVELVVQADSVSSGGVRVLADPTQLQQALLNLCLNARDAMPGGGRITLTAEASDGVPQRVRLKVTDTGEGIADEDRERIFEPFFSTKQDAEHTGLGLSITHGIVQRHGGTISVESTRGLGTTFTLDLPAIAEHSEAMPIEPDVTVEPLPAPPPSMVVVIAQPHAHASRILAAILERSQYRVVRTETDTALATALTGLESASKVVVIDRDLPGDPLGTLRAMRARGDRSPVLVLSSDVGADEAFATEIGAWLLAKPTPVAELPLLVRRAAAVHGLLKSDDLASAIAGEPRDTEPRKEARHD